MKISPQGAESAPVKVSRDVHQLIKYAGVLLDKTHGAIVEQGVAEVISVGKDMLDANHAALMAHEPKPYNADDFFAEVRRRRETA